ncbi:uncharacterized protein LOC134298564 isoform X2 [Anolis carolinensis]|uniref:uncharacterized protein LOC134298564 isoform X2 n=1 Tax=Anolis carolinensis TaxID=28377 RepID=UPI002F2B901E
MLKVRTILLLCGLQIFQQTTAQEGSPLTAVFDDEDVHPQILNDDGAVTELLGGDLLGDLPGGTLDTLGIIGRQRRDLLGGALESKKGLPGNVLGGKAGRLGRLLNLNWKIVDAKLLNVTLKTLPDDGLLLVIPVKLELRSNSSGAAPREVRSSKALIDLPRLLVEVNIKASLQMVQNESGAHKLVVENYMTDPAHIKFLSGTRQLNSDASFSILFDGFLRSLRPIV